MKKVMLGVVLGAAASASVEATDSKVPVFTRNQCTNDTVGDRLMFRVREGIRTSASLSLVEEYGNSVIQLSVVCLDPDSSEQSIVSRYSYSVTAYNSKGVYDFSLTHGVGTCGGDRVSSCAESILAAVDKAITDLRAVVREGKLYFDEG